MKKILLVLVCSLLVVVPVLAVEQQETEVSKAKETAIKENCDEIRTNLRVVQREDAKVRVYLGRYYEEVLRDFITPFNVRLAENALSSGDFVENQNEMTDVKSLFAQDYVNYQKGLEELIGMDCKAEPVKFYEKLEFVRQKRKVMEQDVLRMRSLISEHSKLVDQLKGKIE